MNHLDQVELKLSAQRALLGNIPASLRAVSIESNETEIKFRCIFDAGSTEPDLELLRSAGTEIIADFKSPISIQDDFLALTTPSVMNHLKHLVFLRNESNQSGGNGE